MTGKTRSQGSVDLERCTTVADDGERCTRLPHPHDPDGHHFGRESKNPVDGGRRWSDWIRKVEALKNALIGYELRLADPSTQKIMQLASILELHPIASDQPGFSIISDDPNGSWRTYKDAK